MTAAAPSRAVLSRWMTETLNETIGTAPEKRCASGALYCQLLEAVNPQQRANLRLLSSRVGYVGAPIHGGLPSCFSRLHSTHLKSNMGNSTYSSKLLMVIGSLPTYNAGDSIV